MEIELLEGVLGDLDFFRQELANGASDVATN